MPHRPLDGCVVAFDLDGTLVDTAPDLIGALNVILEEEGLAPVPVAAARSLVGGGARALIARGFAAGGAPLSPARADALFERFIPLYRGRIAEESRPFPGCEAALEALAADGTRLAVCTNKRTDLAKALLDALGLTRRFAAVCGGDLVPTAKPDPALLRLAVQRAGGVPSRALLVGDAAPDTGAARAARVPCVVVDWGYTETPAAELGGEVVISGFAELLGVARQLIGNVELANRE